MKNFYTPEVLKNFIGRKRELAEIEKIKKSKQAECLIIYGRRRVGKTEFIEQGFLGSKILKFEGIQPPKNLNKKEALKYQIDKQLINLANYLQDQKIARLQIDSWYDFFLLLTEYIKEKNLVVYFEEVQWLANYEDYFFAELKPIWDNHWRHNSKLKLVFCGSSPSFLISQLMSDKAFYNRATKEIHLQEFSLAKTGEFMGKRFSDFEKVLAHITVGGIPDYAIVAGNPARIVKMRFSDEEISSLLKIAWWNWEADKIKENLMHICSNDIFQFINLHS